MATREQFMEALGRLGTRYPGEDASDFPAEEPETEENEAPHGDAETEEWNEHQRKMFDIETWSPEAKQWLLEACGADGVAALKRHYQRMYQ